MYSKHQYGAGSYQGGAAASSRSPNNEQLTKGERQFLDDLDNLCIIAGDNTRRPMVEKMARDSTGHLTYKCIPCGMYCTGELAMKDHLYSGIHKASQVQHKGRIQENYSKEECEARLKLYRSQPCTIQSTLDSSSEPMIGLEYIVEISHSGNETPDLYCALCLKWIQNKNILNHLNCLPHNFAYVQRHYPKAYFLYLEQTNFGASHIYNKKKVIKKIIKCVENTYGRQKPLRIITSEFASNRELICKWIHGSHHYNDSDGRTFEDVTDELISELKKRKYEGKEEENRGAPSTRKENKLKMILEDKHNMAIELAKRAEVKAKETLLCHEKNPEQHPLYTAEWKKFWNKRYKEVKAEGKATKTYDYKSEWIVYWKDRSKELYKEELRLAKINIYRKMSLSIPKELDDPPEDMVRNKNKEKRISPEKLSDKSDLRFVINKCRAKDRKSAERSSSTERRRSSDRREFNDKRRLPEKCRSSDRSRQTEKRSSFNRKYSEECRSRAKRRSPDRGRATKRKLSSDRRRSSGRSSHHHDSQRKSMDRTKRLCSGSRSSSRGNASSPRYSDNESMVSLSDDEVMGKDDVHENVNIYSWYSESDESLDSLYDVKSLERSPEAAARSSSCTTNTSGCSSAHVLPILRLLVALEDHLGSLGPKVVDLLTEALKLEKERSNSSEQLLRRDSYLTLLETVKEKLKGASQAGLISGSATTAVRTAIVRITSLLHEADRRAAASNKPIETDKKREAKVKKVIEKINSMDDSSTEEPSPPHLAVDTIDNDSPKPEEAVMPHPMGDLSDIDLVTLLYDFVKLNEEEQDGLIGYLKILETQDPRRVKRLRDYPPPAPTKPPPMNRVRTKSYNCDVEEVSQSVTQNSKRQDLKKSHINVSDLLATVRATVEPSPAYEQLTTTASAILVDTGVIPKSHCNINSPINNAMHVPSQMPSNIEYSNFFPHNQSYNCNPTQHFQYPLENQPSNPRLDYSSEQQQHINNYPENFSSQWVSNSQPPYHESNANNSFLPNNSFGSGNYWEAQPGFMPNASYNMPNAQCNMLNGPSNMPNALYNTPNQPYFVPNNCQWNLQPTFGKLKKKTKEIKFFDVNNFEPY